jgi:SAM-dependent methyltransferase
VAAGNEQRGKIMANTQDMLPNDHTARDHQQPHWAATYTKAPRLFGEEPSAPAQIAADQFDAAGVREMLELGAGYGRDTLFFARRGFQVTALDYAEEGLARLRADAEAASVPDRVQIQRHDVRTPLPFPDQHFDACYSHMLLCMALTTDELVWLVGEVRRVLRPGGLHIYTVRTTQDPHYGKGISHGDGMYETGGFIVHFFDRALVEQLAAGDDLLDITEFEEGTLPRRLFRVTMRRA